MSSHCLKFFSGSHVFICPSPVFYFPAMMDPLFPNTPGSQPQQSLCHHLPHFHCLELSCPCCSWHRQILLTLPNSASVSLPPKAFSDPALHTLLLASFPPSYHLPHTAIILFIIWLLGTSIPLFQESANFSCKQSDKIFQVCAIQFLLQQLNSAAAAQLSVVHSNKAFLSFV